MNFLSLALLSTGAFVSTNIDDLFLLVGFFSDRSFARSHVFAGQILGMAIIVAISLAAASVALVISPQRAGLLGVAPIVIGIGKLLRVGKTEEEAEPMAVGILQVATVTIVNGGDNIAAYTPIFATQGSRDMIATLTIFALLTLVWCFVALGLVRHTALGKPLRRYGHVLLPFILIGLGGLILYRSGAINFARGIAPGLF
ncbi:MAG TPA: cadmium resistance transporter [Roseiarcus sp.]|nr:cadmium resistance transporter [Roseiarcus sp.]